MVVKTEAMIYFSKDIHSNFNNTGVLPSTMINPISFLDGELCGWNSKFFTNAPYVYLNKWVYVILFIFAGEICLDKIYVGSKFEFLHNQGTSNGIITKINKMYIENH